MSKKSKTYSSKIIKAGALVSDTKLLFSNWDSSKTVSDNIIQLQRDNPFGKSSRARVNDILTIFRQRYLAESSTTNSLLALIRSRAPAAVIDRILYFHSARADHLLYDAVIKILAPKYEQGLMDINVQEFQQSLAKWVIEGKTAGHWSPSTINRIAQGLLSTLRDFGVLQGLNKKRISPMFLPIESFAYIIFYLKQHQPSGVKLLEIPDWKLFFLSREGVERFLFEAHQLNLLEYHVAGSVTRLTFPANTLEEYANVIAQR